MKELLAAGEKLLGAQKEALAGKGTERFEEAGKRQRDAIRTLVSAAVGLLEQAGHRPSAATEERMASSLRAASVDPEARSLLESGRLQEEVESSGLDLLAGMAPAGRGTATRRPRASREAALREAREAVKSARDTARERQREAAEADREAKRAAAAADEAAERARELAEAAGRAAEAVEEAEAELERLRSSK